MGVFISKPETEEETPKPKKVKSLSELSNENLTAKILGRKPESLFDRD
jgi:hypothetical protein